MTKVKELRERLCNKIVNSDSFAGFLAPGVLECINSLISASHASGVAEGAERLANQIRFHGGQYTQKGDLVASDYITYAKARVDLFIVPASVLAPTKESEK